MFFEQWLDEKLGWLSRKRFLDVLHWKCGHIKCKNWDHKLTCIVCKRVIMWIFLKKLNYTFIMSDVCKENWTVTVIILGHMYNDRDYMVMVIRYNFIMTKCWFNYCKLWFSRNSPCFCEHEGIPYHRILCNDSKRLLGMDRGNIHPIRWKWRPFSTKQHKYSIRSIFQMIQMRYGSLRWSGYQLPVINRVKQWDNAKQMLADIPFCKERLDCFCKLVYISLYEKN